jgi:hypothetical protein
MAEKLWRRSFGEDVLERKFWRGSSGEEVLERKFWRGSVEGEVSGVEVTAKYVQKKGWRGRDEKAGGKETVDQKAW